MKFLISASLLSAMVFYSSLFPFLHSLNLYFSVTIHKNYMFLLCNGLLVCIVRNSGLIGNSGHRQDQTLQNGDGHDRGAEALEAAMADGGRKAESKVEDGEERETGSVAEVEKNERLITEEENERLITEEEEEEDEDEDEDEEEEEVGILSKEELNQKCEEFIRKMKAGIKFESQQVVVF